MAAENDIYQVKHFQRDGAGQDCLNIYYYQATEAPGSALSLATEFEAVLLPAIKNIQDDSIVHVLLEVINLGDPADFLAQVLSGTGNQSGTPLPSFVSMAFRLIRASRALRNGRKSYVGLIEELVGARGSVDPVLQGFLDTLAGLLGSNLVDTVNGVTYAPRIVRKDPATGIVTDSIAVAGAEFTRVATQNTRKQYN